MNTRPVKILYDNVEPTPREREERIVKAWMEEKAADGRTKGAHVLQGILEETISRGERLSPSPVSFQSISIDEILKG